MENILNIVNKLQETSGRIEKENILKQHKENQLWKEILHFVYNPYIVTGISKKKINKKIKEIYRTAIPTNILEVMDYLKRNNTGKDSDIFVIQNFINKQPEESQELLIKIVTKDLSLGVDSKTINKVYGKIIPTFDVMLAHKYSDHEHKVNGNFILTEKLDGIRCILIKDVLEEIKMFSRQGQLIEGLIEIEEEAINLPNGVYDGELILRNDNNLNSDDLYRATVKVVRKDGIKKNVEFHVFDMMSVKDFQNGCSKSKCDFRKENLECMVDEFIWIKSVPILYKGNDKEVIPAWLDYITNQGKEGLMLNIADAPYECKRSDKILKIKKMHTVDLKIIGFEEGTGKYEGVLGRLNVDYKGYVVGVGSGFSDEDRGYIWSHQNDLLGTIVEVQYFEESKNQDGGVSLRFPVFKRFRNDKTEISYS